MGQGIVNGGGGFYLLAPQEFKKRRSAFIRRFLCSRRCLKGRG